MALPAGRVGVKPDQVDWQGNIIGGGGGGESLLPRVQSLETNVEMLHENVEGLEDQVGTFEFLTQDGVAGYKKTGADTFHPFRRIEEYTVTHNNANLVEVTRQDTPDLIFSYLVPSTGAVQNDFLLKEANTSLGAHGTGASAGGNHTGCITMVRDVSTGVSIISHKSFNSNYYGTFNIILVWY